MLLGTRNSTEQVSILYGWVRKWRAGGMACPIAPPATAVLTDQVGTAKLDFLTWKLGRKDLALEAAKLLRAREAAYKAAQRKRIACGAGEVAFKWQRSLEQQERRLLDRTPILRRASDGTLQLHVSHRWVDAKPDRYWIFVQGLGGSGLLGRRRQTIAAALMLGSEGASVKSFTLPLQRAYASYFWSELWACAEGLSKPDPFGDHVETSIDRHRRIFLFRGLRRQLLRVAPLVDTQPIAAAIRLTRIGLDLPSKLKCLATDRGVGYGVAFRASVAHEHIRASGVPCLDLDAARDRCSTDLGENFAWLRTEYTECLKRLLWTEMNIGLPDVD